MKNFILLFFLLCTFIQLRSQSTNCDDCNAIKDAYIASGGIITENDVFFKYEDDRIKFCPQAIETGTLMFRFSGCRTPRDIHVKGRMYTVVNGAVEVEIDDIQANEDFFITYVNHGGSNTDKTNTIQLKSTPGTYFPPDDVWTVSTNGLSSFQIPSGIGYSGSSLMNNNSANIYVKYADAASPKITKPIIFVDGLDFNTNEIYDRDGKVPVRIGSTGWDVFVKGVDRAIVEADQGENNTYGLYPAAFDQMLSEGYDILFIDFSDGSDWIQRNGEIFIEALKRINQEKTADQNGITHANTVVGASMGGQIARWGLVKMENKGIDHCTGTYVSFDSPHKGANIPLSLQGFALAGKISGAEPGLWKNLNKPAPRQLIIAHLGAELEAGRCEFLWEEDEKSGTYSFNINTHSKDEVMSEVAFEGTQKVRDAYVQEMASIGYPEKCRNIGITCGTGSNQNQGYTPREMQVRAVVNASPLSGVGFTADLFALGGTPYGVSHSSLIHACNAIVSFPPIFNSNLSWTSYNHSKFGKSILFAGNLAADDNTLVIGIPLNNFGTHHIPVKTKKNTPCTYHHFTLYEDFDYPTYDNVQGCKRSDFRGLRHKVKEFGSNASVDIQPDFCFMPTMSTLDLDWDMDSDNMVRAIYNPNIVDDNSTPFDAVYIPVENLNHVELDDSMTDFILGEVVKVPPLSAPSFAINSQQSYNYGDKEIIIPSVDIADGSQLSVNRRTGTAYGGGPLAKQAKFDTYTGILGCGAEPSRINVFSGGVFSLGNDITTGGYIPQSGIAHIREGSEVHIFPGGKLQIYANSALLIEKGAKLWLDPGAIIEVIQNPHTGDLVQNATPKIRIEEGGFLQVDGEIEFSGDGHFEFEEGHITQLPDNFSLTGSGKDFRFIHLLNNAVLLKEGGNLQLQEGMVEVNAGASIKHIDGQQTYAYNVRFEGKNTGGNINNWKGLDVENMQSVVLQKTDFDYFRKGLEATNVASIVYVDRCTFKHSFYGLDIQNGKYVYMNEVNSELSSFRFNDMAKNADIGVRMKDCHFLGQGNLSSTIEMEGVKLLIMDGGEMDGSGSFEDYSLTGIKALVGKNNIIMRKGATIRNMYYGIHLDGWGGDNHFGNGDYGLIQMDCARILNCQTGINADDPILDIDPGFVSNGHRPNEFGLGRNDANEKYFNIEYKYREPDMAQFGFTGAVWANYNDWNKPNNAGPDPVDYEITRSTSSGVQPVPLYTFAVLNYDPSCPNPPQGPPEVAEMEYCECEQEGQNHWETSMLAFERMEEAYEYAAEEEGLPNLYESQAYFENIAAQDSYTMDAIAPACHHLQKVAKVFVQATGEGEFKQGSGLQILEDLTPPTSLSAARVWPNPASTSCQILLPDYECSFEIRDALGNLMYEASNKRSFQVLNTATWKSGMYFIHFQKTDGSERGVIKSLVIQNL